MESSTATNEAQFTVRLPGRVADRIDHIAESAGLTRTQLVRILLSKASADDLPAALIQHADVLRISRGR